MYCEGQDSESFTISFFSFAFSKCKENAEFDSGLDCEYSANKQRKMATASPIKRIL